MADDFETGGAGAEESGSGGESSLPASEQFVQEVVEKASGVKQEAPREEAPTERPSAAAAGARARIDEAYRRRRENENALREAREQTVSTQRELAQLRQQIAQQTQAMAPPQNPDPEPDRNDQHKWAQWAMRQAVAPYGDRVAQLEQHMRMQAIQTYQQQVQYQQQQYQAQAYQGEMNRVDQLEAEYESVSPGYRNRVDSYLAQTTQMHQAQGYTPEVAAAQAIQDLYALWRRGEQMGRHPANFVDSYLGGYGDGAQQAAEEAMSQPEPPPVPRRVRELREAQSAPESGSLSQGGSRAPQGNDPVTQLTRGGKGAARAKDLHKALRGQEVRDPLNALYSTAWVQGRQGR
jgi:hypothetical protein